MEAGIVITLGVVVAACFGLIVRMMDQALTSRAWRGMHWPTSARLEVRQLARMSLPRRVQDAIGALGARPTRYELTITTYRALAEKWSLYEAAASERQAHSLQRELRPGRVRLVQLKEGAGAMPRGYSEWFHRAVAVGEDKLPRSEVFSMVVQSMGKSGKVTFESEPGPLESQFVQLAGQTGRHALEQTRD